MLPLSSAEVLETTLNADIFSYCVSRPCEIRVEPQLSLNRKFRFDPDFLAAQALLKNSISEAIFADER
jgi:hypothetical protein